MPDRQVLSNVPRGARVKGTSNTVKKITNWDEMARGQRGHKNLWLPIGQDGAIVSDLGNTAGIALKFGASTIPAPPNAVAYHIFVRINANTVSTGFVRLHIVRFEAGSSSANDSAISLSCPMFSAAFIAQCNGTVPIAKGPGLYYYTVTAGTVNYDIQAWVVGYVLE